MKVFVGYATREASDADKEAVRKIVWKLQARFGEVIDLVTVPSYQPADCHAVIFTFLHGPGIPSRELARSMMKFSSPLILVYGERTESAYPSFMSWNIGGQRAAQAILYRNDSREILDDFTNALVSFCVRAYYQREGTVPLVG